MKRLFCATIMALALGLSAIANANATQSALRGLPNTPISAAPPVTVALPSNTMTASGIKPPDLTYPHVIIPTNLTPHLVSVSVAPPSQPFKPVETFPPVKILIFEKKAPPISPPTGALFGHIGGSLTQINPIVTTIHPPTIQGGTLGRTLPASLRQ
jgi:hypothetical protein